MHHSLTYLSREHMNPKLTCSQRQWLHSSGGRASHRYREVTGLSPVEVLNFFQASLRNGKNCDHNCEDHSSFDCCLCCTEYYLEDVIQMLSFVPPLPEKKKKREETEDDEEVQET